MTILLGTWIQNENDRAHRYADFATTTRRRDADVPSGTWIHNENDRAHRYADFATIPRADVMQTYQGLPMDAQHKEAL
jgi:hypothetical protein